MKPINTGKYKVNIQQRSVCKCTVISEGGRRVENPFQRLTSKLCSFSENRSLSLSMN